MIDNDTVSDAEIVRLVAAHNNELAKVVQARLRRLRLERVSGPPPRHRPGPTLLAVVRKRLGL